MDLKYFGIQSNELKLFFGIIALVVGGISLITPPVGRDVCIINTLAHGVPVIETSETVVQLNF